MHSSFRMSNAQWKNIKNYLPLSRQRKYSVRSIFAAVVYLTKTGCQWRSLPRNFPPLQLVYYYFRSWGAKGIINKIMLQLTQKLRVKCGRSPEPFTAIIDSQSVRTGPGIKDCTGWDGAKKIKGRKRHLVTDTLGLPLAIRVGSARATDREGMAALAPDIEKCGSHILFADKGYIGICITENVVLRIVTLQDKNNCETGVPETETMHKRWVIERTWGWLTHYRRLTRDYERLVKCSKAFIQIAFIAIMTNRI